MSDAAPGGLVFSPGDTCAIALGAKQANAHPSVPVKTVKELVALARARPAQLSYGSAGNGTIPHLLAEMLKSETKINLPHVPYKSTAAAIYAATSGEVPTAFGGIFAIRGEMEKRGKIIREAHIKAE